MTAEVNCYSAIDAARAIQAGEITSVELVESCLSRIDNRESSVRAWQSLDRESVLQQARDLDLQEKNRPLHGVPVGIKDIVDTDELPTTYGSPIYTGHRPGKNADCISRLKEAGAIILGKTVTTEFAYLDPGKTRNPHNIEHTPGGSSSGSAAAVADKHVPLALGTQTAGSIIRPASYCGVVGYKPTFNSFSFYGIHPFAPSFDTLGGFARSVADIVLLRSVLADDEMKNVSRAPAKIALLQGPNWHHAEEETRVMFEKVTKLLGKSGLAESVALPDVFLEINEAHKKVMLGECIYSLKDIYENQKNGLSEKLLQDYEYAMTLNEQELSFAGEIIEKCKQEIASVFSKFDLILTPASAGRAPKGLASTGDPVFNRMWTAMGLPCISLPCPQNDKTLPLGVQLVGTYKGDDSLLAYASWFEDLLNNQKFSR